ncbi:MAG TPA: hypothetical protein VGD36_18835 [Xanthobacteraceae bacterium]
MAGAAAAAFGACGAFGVAGAAFAAFGACGAFGACCVGVGAASAGMIDDRPTSATMMAMRKMIPSALIAPQAQRISRARPFRDRAVHESWRGRRPIAAERAPVPAGTAPLPPG